MGARLVIGGREWPLTAALRAEDLPGEAWAQAVGRAVGRWFDGSDEVALRTSGSTGAPRTVVHGKEAMRASAERTAEVLGLKVGTRALLAMPVEFVGGFMMLVRAIEGGWRLEAVEPRARVVAPEGTEFAALTPMQARASGEGVKGVGKLLLGGAPAEGGMRTAGEVWESFGMTETISHIAVRRLWPEPVEPAFRVVRGVEVRTDAAGCLHVRAPHLFAGELATRDVVELAGAGAFVWKGRADDVINSGGVKVHPEEVEAAAGQITPRPCRAYGAPHPDLGFEVVLAVHGTGTSAEAEALRLALHELLPKHHAPRRVEFRVLDTTPSGKWKRPRP